MITKSVWKSLTRLNRMRFSGDHHKAYDWRDDHSKNTDY